MLSKLLSKPIELQVGNKTITFSSIDDFEFSLNARTAITPDRVVSMISATFDEINDELKSIGAAKFELDRLSSESPDVSTGITMRLKTIDTAIFSKEHSWRDIFIALNGYDSLNLSKYKNIALKKYLQYLKNRSNIANNIKAQMEFNRNRSGENKSSDFNDTMTIMATPDSLSTIEADTDTLHKELNLSRLPKANPAILEINEGDTIDIYLAKYKCKLVSDNGLKFIDIDNVSHVIEPGRCKVGRGKESDIKLSDSLREISRLHLLIETDGQNEIKCTDLSVQGTYFPNEINFK